MEEVSLGEFARRSRLSITGARLYKGAPDSDFTVPFRIEQ